MDAASSVILPPVGFFCKAKPLLLQIGGPSLIGVAHSAPGRSKGKGKRSMRGRSPAYRDFTAGRLIRDAFAVRKRLGDLYPRYSTKYSGFNPQLKGRITPAMRGGLKFSLELTNGTPPESSATGE
jgi:hypothetical protein